MARKKSNVPVNTQAEGEALLRQGEDAPLWACLGLFGRETLKDCASLEDMVADWAEARKADVTEDVQSAVAAYTAARLLSLELLRRQEKNRPG